MQTPTVTEIKRHGDGVVADATCAPQRRRLPRSLAGLMAAGALLATTSPVAQASPLPLFVPGNPTCADIQGLEHWREVKIDPVGAGSHSFGDGVLTGVAKVDPNNWQFSWTASQGVDAVIAKGGPMANVYRYTPEATGDAGALRAPVNLDNTNGFYGLSHISFCYDADPKPTPDPKPPVPPTTPPVTQPKPTVPPTTPPVEKPYGPDSIAVPVPDKKPEVKGVQYGPGKSKLSGPSGCMTSTAKATVSGRHIKSVTFTLDGKRRARMSAASGQKRFTITLHRSALKTGVHRLTARVVYAKSSATRAKTHKLAFQRCARAAVAPHFAG